MGKNRLQSKDDMMPEKGLELRDKIYEVCQESYKKGQLSSETVIKVLDKAVHQLKLEVEPNKAKSKKRLQESSRKIFGLNRAVVITSIGVLIVTILIHMLRKEITMADILPKRVIEQRCWVPNFQLLMQAFRPIADCSLCKSKDGPLHIDADKFKGSIKPLIVFNNKPTKGQFSKVAYSSRPIIVRNGLDANLTFSQLKQIFESVEGGVQSVSEECQFLSFRSPFKTLRHAFDEISDTAQFKEPWYIGWSNCNPGVSKKLRTLFPRPDFLPDNSESSAIDWIFVGSPGMGAAMHVDTVKRPSWQIQLMGSKHWSLRPPPECESVCPISLDLTIRPRDIFFLDTNVWFHETKIVGKDLSISIGSEYD